METPPSPKPESYRPVARMSDKAAELRQQIASMGFGKELPPARFSSAQPSTSTLGAPKSPEPGEQLTPGTGTGTVSASDYRPDPAYMAATAAANQRAGKAGRRPSAADTHLSELFMQSTQQCKQLEDELRALQASHRSLSKDLQQRQESYMRREEQMQEQIVSLQEQLAALKCKDDDDEGEAGESARGSKHEQNINQLQVQVLGGLEGLLDKQRMHLKAEEANTLRGFRCRLAEIEAQVRGQRENQDQNQASWMQKTITLRHELDETQGIAHKLDKMYTQCEEECRRLRAQYKCQEDDRQYVIRQMLKLKKENQKLRDQVQQVNDELRTVMDMANDVTPTPTTVSQLTSADPSRRTTPSQSRPVSRTGHASASAAAPHAPAAAGALSKHASKVERYQAAIEGLKKLAESERRAVRRANAALTVEMQQRTELQTTLLQWHEQVRQRRMALEQELAACSPEDPAAPADEAPTSTYSAWGPRNNGVDGGRSSSSGRPQTAGPGMRRSADGAARRPMSAVARSSSSSSHADSNGHNYVRSQAAGAAEAVRPWAATLQDQGLQEKQQMFVSLQFSERLLQLLLDRAFPGAAATNGHIVAPPAAADAGVACDALHTTPEAVAAPATASCSAATPAAARERAQKQRPSTAPAVRAHSRPISAWAGTTGRAADTGKEAEPASPSGASSKGQEACGAQLTACAGQQAGDDAKGQQQWGGSAKPWVMDANSLMQGFLGSHSARGRTQGRR